MSTSRNSVINLAVQREGNTSCLAQSIPTTGPICSLWGLLASLHLSPNWTSQHVHLSPFCPLTCCQPLSDIQWNIRGNEFCVSVLSGSFAIQAGWWAWCSHRKSADQAGRGFLFPGIVATCMLSRSQVAWSWVVRGTGLSEMSCSQQARHDRRGSWSPGHSLQESHRRCHIPGEKMGRV